MATGTAITEIKGRRAEEQSLSEWTMVKSCCDLATSERSLALTYADGHHNSHAYEHLD